MAETPVTSTFQRIQNGWRFAFGGLNLRDFPDAIGPTKYQSAVNVRATSTQSLQTRPGYVPFFNTGGYKITDIRSYSAPYGTPRYLARDTNDNIWLDTGVNVGNVGSPGGAWQGATFIPFRPNASSNAWMYIASTQAYKKFSLPSASNTVTSYNVGIPEPQAQCQAAAQGFAYYDFTPPTWTATFSDPTYTSTVQQGGRSACNMGTAIQDPLNPSRYFVSYIASQQVQQSNEPGGYGIGETVSIGYGDTGSFQPINGIIEDVFTPIASCSVLASYYNSATNTTTFQISAPSTSQVSTAAIGVGDLRQNSMVNIGGTIYLATNVVTALDGTACFDVVGNVSGGSVSGVNSIAVTTSTNPGGQTVVGNLLYAGGCNGTSQFIATGISSPFGASLNGNIPQSDDYFHISLACTQPQNISEIKVVFNIDPKDPTPDSGSLTPTFEINAYYYSFSPSLLNGVVANTQTQLSAVEGGTVQSFLTQSTPIPPNMQPGSIQMTEFWIPISSLIRIGTNNTLSLLNTNAVELVLETTGTVDNVFWGAMWVGGGGQPDVGDNGAPYKYRVVPRNSATGAVGNPSPEMRYGVASRRQAITVTLPSSSDVQADYWDVYRTGGTINSYRYLGSTSTLSSTFTDNYFDTATEGGSEIEVDNFQPWPSVDNPFTTNSGIFVAGKYIALTGGVQFPANIASWLPGTLVQINGTSAYTLRMRPTAISGGWLLHLQECASKAAINATSLVVQEPIVANRVLPFMFGPDVAGTMFAVGDPLRPGFLSFSKSNNPDAAPDSYNLELCPPSEPLLGGIIKGGVAIVASTKRWWALYPNFGGVPRYQAIEQSVGRGLAATWGHITDGTYVYFWARDGICRTDGSGAYVSLTDADLYPLFPHEGVLGQNVTKNGVVYYAPDYTQSGKFRLSKVNQYLYADYVDVSGNYHTLVFDINNNAWSADIYHDGITMHYGVEQQEGISTLTNTYYPLAVMGSNNGTVFQQQTNQLDNGSPIPCALTTFEWDGGDSRVVQLFGDSYLDCVPNSAISVQPVSKGLNAANVSATVIAANATRTLAPISMNGGQLTKFLGLQLVWTESTLSASNNYSGASVGSTATMINMWQHSVSPQVETLSDRSDDWTDCGVPSLKFFQGFRLDCDTYGQNKNITIIDAETGNTHAFTPSPVNHNGRNIRSYSFTTPFTSHMVRRASADSVPYRQFEIQYIWEPTPSAVQTWETQYTSHGMPGFQTIARILIGYSSNTPVTLTIAVSDGTAPQPITLPSTGGVYKKIVVVPTFNKGLLFQYTFTSTGPFQLWKQDIEIMIAVWGRTGMFTNYPLVGGTRGDQAGI